MSYDPQQKFLTSAYGELLAAQKTPLVQISARYGLIPELLQALLGGTATFLDNMFVASTSTGASNVAAIISARESAQRAGQGLSCEISAVFTQGVANNTQEAGFISSESAICFGYNGVDFGILIASGGQLEHQDLIISGFPAGAENASITVDGVLHSVPLSGATIPRTAYEIATYLNANEPRYRFASNVNTVTALARLPDFGDGAWAFSSSTATAAWTEIKNGTLATETWINKTDWNENPNITIDPTKYNEYRIQINANVEFYIKDADTGDYELAHVFKHLGVGTASLIGNPTFRVGWATRNTGNTSNVSVSGFFASTFVEGQLKYTQPTFSASNVQASVPTSLTNIISFRNRSVYLGTANRSEILPRLLSFGTDSTKPSVFEIWANPQTNTYLDWTYLDSANSLMEIATNPALIIGGQLVGTITVASSEILEVNKIVKFQIPTAEFSIAARAPVSTADMTVSGIWIEDK